MDALLSQHKNARERCIGLDLDGEGRPDTAILGKLIEEPQEDGTLAKVFHPDQDGDVQGIYLSSRGESEGAPDLIRQADTAKELTPTGWLASISQEDLQNTDVLVFREATGELILERRGLRDAEVQGRGAIGLGKDEGLYYRLMLRGPRDSDLANSTVRESAFTDWATRNQFTEPYRQRAADHLKSGEWVRLIAINRNTGYVGSQRVQLSDASQGGLLSFPVPALVMRPPHLRVWAEREYEVEQGLTQGEERQYLVGAEGASLTSDALVTVYTEWLDHDGRPLPEGLGAAEGRQYGLTGRLAKVVAENTLAPATDGGVQGGDLANFPIGPGLQKQVLHFKDNPSRPEHYYIHVSGTQFNEGPSFDTGTAAAPLDSRPGYLTPFLTPLYDEDSHWQEYNAYRDLKREKQETPGAIEPTKPLPAYAWQYRPEYQFSRLSLEINEINRVSKDEAGEETKENLLDMTTPVVASSDDLIEVLYSLIEAESPRLDPIDGPQELVFAVGEEEVSVELKADRTIHIDNLDHLASLDPEDFLTMRLYVNQDAGNVLWEYAFEYLALDALQDVGDRMDEQGMLHLSADDPVLDLQAILFGYASRDAALKTEKRVYWFANGNGTMFPPVVQDSEQGVFNSTLTMPTWAGARVKVKARLDSGEEMTDVDFGELVVDPGVPAAIAVTTNGEPSVAGHGAMNVVISVRDAHDNSVKDGTAVAVSVAGDAVLDSDAYATVGGSVSVVVRGGESSSATNVLTVRAGEVEQQLNFAVHPFNIALEAFDTEQNAGSQSEVTVRLIDHEGNPVSGFPISLHSTHGLFLGENITTGQDGRARATLMNPPFAATANIIVTANTGSPLVQSYTVIETTPPVFDTRDSLVVGDLAGGAHIPMKAMTAVRRQSPIRHRRMFASVEMPARLHLLNWGRLLNPIVRHAPPTRCSKSSAATCLTTPAAMQYRPTALPWLRTAPRE